MKAGNLVKFKPPYYLSSVDGVYPTETKEAPWFTGLLVEYEKISVKMCTIFYDNQNIRIMIRNVQKLTEE
jgi:hypothetical protein